MNIRIIILVAIAVSFFSACSKNFEKINSNPNAPEMVTPDLLLPYGIKMVTNYYWGANDESLGMSVGNQFSQHWAGIQYADIDRYQVPQNLISLAWKTFFVDGLENFDDVERLGKEMEHPNYQAVAKILKSWTFSIITDIWGDIPYKNALNAGQKIYSPEYDSQKEIYESIVAELKEANDMIVGDRSPIQGDILNGGNLLKWKKFANALSLRLLNRMYGKEGLTINVKAEVERIINNPAQYPLPESNADIIQLKYLSAQPNTNPVYVNRISRDDFRVSETLVEALKETGDERLHIFADPAELSGDYRGIPNGLPNAVSLGLNKTSKVGGYFTAAQAPAVLISYAELLLIKAELGYKSVAMAADVAENYEAGIKASFGQYGLTPSSGFLNAVSYKGGVEGFNQILTQKWIALFGQGLEAWTEQRRTGIPDLRAPEASTNGGIIPTRLAYPLSEEALNFDNFKTALKEQGGENDMKMKLWWAK